MKSFNKKTMIQKEKKEKTHNKKRIRKEKASFKVDIALVFIIAFLMMFGIIMVYSASYSTSFSSFGNHVFYLKKQLLWSLIGIICMYVVSKIPYKFISNNWMLAYATAIICLVLVLIIGEEINGAKRWLDFKIIGFQPSELAKLAVILSMAMVLNKTKKHITNWKVLLVDLVVVIIPTILVARENMSTAFVIFIIGAGMIFITMPNFKSVLKYMILPGGVLLGLMFVLSGIFIKDYQMIRWQTFIDGPWSDPTGKGYQTVQSLYAVGSGGLFGKGLGNSMQKNGFIPEAHNDIIFSIVCEELGLFGAVCLIILFLMLLYRCLNIALNAKDTLGMLIVAGIMIQIGIQVMINLAVVTNSMPNTGMPLPFISYGGSSLLFLMIEMGLVLNISRNSGKEQLAVSFK